MELTKTKFKQTELGLIPEDWKVLTLGEIGEFKNGINKSKEDFGFGFPFVNLMDVFGKPKIFGNEKFDLINSNDTERKLYNLKKGDVLFIRSSVKPSGVGLTSVISVDLNDTVFSGFLIRFRDKLGIDNNYKLHCFYDSRFRSDIISNSSVSANTNINQEALKKLRLKVPPLPEQKAIAQVLSDTDTLIQTLEQKLAKKRVIKQGAMQQLLTPKEDWMIKKLGEIAHFYNGKAHEQYIDAYGEFIVINSKFVSTSGNVSKNSTVNLSPLKKGDITMVMSDIPNGKALAKCFIVPIDNKYALNQRICAIRAETVDNDFLYLILNRNEYYLAFDSGTGQTNLKKNDVLECPIPLPRTKSEQIQIANILFDMDAEIAHLEQKLDKYKLLKQGLMQELLTGRIRLV